MKKSLFLSIVLLCLVKVSSAQYNCALTRTNSGPITHNNWNGHKIYALHILNTNPDSAAIELHYCSNDTIVQCFIDGNKTVIGDSAHVSQHAIHTYHCHGIVVENNYIQNGATLMYNEFSDGIVFNNNDCKNATGPYPRGAMIQLNRTTNTTLTDSICYNRMQNITGLSHPEDAINCYMSYGTAAHPILIIGNSIDGGGPSITGSGITVGDGGGAYTYVFNNKVRNSGHVGIQTAGGTHISIQRNTIYGAPGFAWAGVGLASSNFSGMTAAFDTVAHNTVNWVGTGGYQRDTTYRAGAGANYNPVPFGLSTNTVRASINATILPTTFLSSLSCIVSAALPPYNSSNEKRVLWDRAKQATEFFAVPSGPTPYIPAYVPDSLKNRAIFRKTGGTKDTLGCFVNSGGSWVFDPVYPTRAGTGSGITNKTRNFDGNGTSTQLKLITDSAITDNTFILAWNIHGDIVKINANLTASTNKLNFNGIGVQSTVPPASNNDMFRYGDFSNGISNGQLGGNLTKTTTINNLGHLLKADSIQILNDPVNGNNPLRLKDSGYYQKTISFNNGLTNANSTVQLGGNLIQDVSIYTNDHTFQIQDGDFGYVHIGGNSFLVHEFDETLTGSVIAAQPSGWGLTFIKNTDTSTLINTIDYSPSRKGIRVVDDLDSIGMRYVRDYSFGKKYDLYIPNWGQVKSRIDSAVSVHIGASSNADSLVHHSSSYYLSRTNHTGTQAQSTVSNLPDSLLAKQNKITQGLTSQYFDGKFGLHAFPTNVSSFTNDANYIDPSALSPYRLKTDSSTFDYGLNKAAHSVKVDTSQTHGPASKDYVQGYGYTKAQVNTSQALKVNYTDTAAMLGGSVHKNGAETILGPKTYSGKSTYSVPTATAALNFTNTVINPVKLFNITVTDPTTSGRGGFIMQSGATPYSCTVATTAATGTGTIATLTFPVQVIAPFLVGSSIVVSGVTPSGYNGTFVVTACTTIQVSFANTTTAAQTVAGTITLTINDPNITYGYNQDASGNVILSGEPSHILRMETDYLQPDGNRMMETYFTFGDGLTTSVRPLFFHFNRTTSNVLTELKGNQLNFEYITDPTNPGLDLAMLTMTQGISTFRSASGSDDNLNINAPTGQKGILNIGYNGSQQYLQLSQVSNANTAELSLSGNQTMFLYSSVAGVAANGVGIGGNGSPQGALSVFNSSTNIPLIYGKTVASNASAIWYITDNSGNQLSRMDKTGRFAPGSTSVPTAWIHVPQGGTAAGSAPFKYGINSLATTAASGSGTTATLTYATQGVAPYTVGQTIIVAGVTPSGYNGTFVVSACTTTQVSWLSATTGSQTVAGTIIPQTAANTSLTVKEPGAKGWNGQNETITTNDGIEFTMAKTLTATATLDFTSTAAQTSSELTVTVTGAADGDIVIVSPPNASSNANSCFTARVSSANTVTVKFNNYSSGAIDPASGTFRVAVLKY